eukprot:TRINITY_DN5649_c0_g1_i1.p2 TRINITY_DN5649_c0_g1~~TRINITY_DN5649_c0_g1_i1.p2  ORF type:complete len:568 (+),score=201.16 TRINITY_DN5649_c0_g1_i1:76-1704(+)
MRSAALCVLSATAAHASFAKYLPPEALSKSNPQDCAEIRWSRVPDEYFRGFDGDATEHFCRCDGVNSSQMEGLRPKAVSDMPASCVSTITPQTFGAMSQAQLRELDKDVGYALTAEQVGTLSGAQCVGFAESGAFKTISCNGCRGMSLPCLKHVPRKRLFAFQERCSACPTPATPPAAPAPAPKPRAPAAAKPPPAPPAAAPSLQHAQAVSQPHPQQAVSQPHPQQAVSQPHQQAVSQPQVHPQGTLAQHTQQAAEQQPAQTIAGAQHVHQQAAAGPVKAQVRRRVQSKRLDEFMPAAALPNGFMDINTVRWSAVPPEMMENVGDDYAKLLTQCQDLTEAQVAALPPSIWKVLNPACVTSMKAVAFSGLTAEQAFNVAPQVTAAMSARKAAGIKPEVCAAFGQSEGFQTMGSGVCAGLSSTCVALIRPQDHVFITQNCFQPLQATSHASAHARRLALRDAKVKAALQQPAPVKKASTGGVGGTILAMMAVAVAGVAGWGWATMGGRRVNTFRAAPAASAEVPMRGVGVGQGISSGCHEYQTL